MTKVPLIILSGAYSTPDIVAEFGRLPPTMLPAGGRRLYEHQLAFARQIGAEPYLTLPDDFALDPWDEQRLEQLGARIIRSPAGLSLNRAIDHCLAVVGAEREVILLHGDTLVSGFESWEPDTIAVASSQGYYEWGEVLVDDDRVVSVTQKHGDGVSPRLIACGLFVFSNATQLTTSLHRSRSFTDMLTDYAATRPLRVVNVDSWLDFGHSTSMYQSKRNMLVSRAFNAVSSGDGIAVTKTTAQRDKLLAEINWYRSIPEPMRAYAPPFLGETTNGDSVSCHIEYLYHPTVAELFVFGDLPTYVWRSILSSSAAFLDLCSRYRPVDVDTMALAAGFHQAMILDRSRERTEKFLTQRGWSDDTPIVVNGKSFGLGATIDALLERIPPPQPTEITAWHGDFFFGNMLFDYRASRVRAIDPRGGYGSGEPTIYGDLRYDLAKLSHSILGGYDAILSGFASLRRLGEKEYEFYRHTTRQMQAVADTFWGFSAAGRSVKDADVRALTALLFLTMLPLHAEDGDRQDMLLCNGLLLATALLEDNQ